jgi:hypothetical protein
MIVQQGFPEEVARAIDGTVTARLHLVLAPDGQSMSGDFTPQKIEFTYDPPKMMKRSFLRPSPRRYRLVSRQPVEFGSSDQTTCLGPLQAMTSSCVTDRGAERKPRVNRLKGAWRSDAAATFAEIRKIESMLSPNEIEMLHSPGLLGHMVQVFRDRRALVIFEGKCNPPGMYSVVDLPNGKLRLVNEDAPRTEKEIEVREDVLLIPLGGEANTKLNAVNEVFRRVPIADVEKEFPCVREAFGDEG